MNALTYYRVNVFAQDRCRSGNPVTVFRNAGGLPSHAMHEIAREHDSMPTVFLLSDAPASAFDVKVFTAAGEAPFAVYPLLAATFVIKEYILRKATETVELKINGMNMRGVYRGEGWQDIWMKPGAHSFDERFSSYDASRLLGIEEREFDYNFLVCRISGKQTYIMVPVRDSYVVRQIPVAGRLSTLHAARVSGIGEMYHQADSAICVFAHDSSHEGYFDISTFYTDKPSHYDAKMFEGGATGNELSCLAAYIAKYGYHKISGEMYAHQKAHGMDDRTVLTKMQSAQPGETVGAIGGEVWVNATGQWYID